MAANVEERIVDMQFNNKQFEEGIKSTTKSLENFEETLNKLGSKTGKLDGLLSGLEHVKDGFSVLEGAVSVMLGNIASKAVSVGAQVANAFVFGGISDGFREYETGLNSVQTIMTNTSANAASAAEATTRAIAQESEAAQEGIAATGAASTTGLRFAQQDAMDAMRETHSASLDALIESQDKEDEELEKHHNGQLESVEKYWDDQLQVREDTYDKEMVALEKSLDKERDLLDKNHQATLDQYEEEYMAKLKSIDETRYNELAAIDSKIEKLREANEQEAESARLASESARIAELRNKISSAESAEERKRAEQDLAEYQEKLASDQRKRDRDAQIEQFNEEKDAIKDKFDTQKTEAKSAYDQQKEDAKSVYEDDKTNLKEQQDATLKSFKDTYDAEKKVLEGNKDFAIDQMKTIHDEETKNQDKSQKTALDNLQKEYDAAEKALSRQQQLELSSASAVHSQKLQNISKEEEAQANRPSLQSVLGIDPTVAPDYEHIEEVLKTLNNYADNTIYNFGQMTENLGRFTAAGTDLDTAAIAIKGISNLGAAAGSSNEYLQRGMFQLSQALANGKLTLMDWNSVIQAGFGGKMFQNEILDTARHHGIAVDDMIAKEGEFRLTLQNGWLSSDILMETLAKFTGDLTDEQLKLLGYTNDEIKRIQEMAGNANDAAQQIKTFTQLIDTLKEATGSGWAETFKILIGDFEEAKILWSEVDSYVGGFIKDSAADRNHMLDVWKAIGGRDDLFQGLMNSFDGLKTILGPIGQAFEETFSFNFVDLKNLTQAIEDATEKFGLNEDQMMLLHDAAKGLFDLFGLAGDVFGTFVEIVGRIAGLFVGDLLNGTLEVAGGIGEVITGFREMVNQGDYLGTFADIVVGAVEGIKTGIETAIYWLTGENSLGAALGDFFKSGFDAVTQYDYSSALTTTAESIKKVYDGILPIIEPIVTKIAELGGSFKEEFTKIVDAIKATLDEATFSASNFLGIDSTGIALTVQGIVDGFNPIQGLADTVLGAWTKVTDAFNWVKTKLQEFWGWVSPYIAPLVTDLKLMFASISSEDVSVLMDAGIIAAILYGLNKLKEIFEPAAKFLESITGIFDGVRGALEAYQNKLKADTLITIGAAVALLAGGIIALSFIPEAKLSVAVTTMTTLFIELAAMFALINKLGVKGGSAAGIGAGFMGIALAMVTFAGVIQLFGSMDTEKTVIGLTVLTGLLTELAIFTKLVGGSKNMAAIGFGLLEIATAVLMFVPAILILAAIPVETFAKGSTMLGLMLLELAAFVKLAGGAQNMVGIGFGLNEIAVAMMLLIPSIAIMGNMDVETLGQGVIALGALLTELGIFTKAVGGSKNMISIGLGLDILAFGLGMMINSIIKLSENMNDNMGAAFAVMTGVLLDTIGAIKLLGKENFKSILTTVEAIVLVIGTLELLTFALSKIATQMPPNIGDAVAVMAAMILETWAAIKLLGNIQPKQALTTLENVAIFMGGIGLLIAAFGALDAVDGSNDFMQRGIEIITSMQDVLLVVLAFMGEAWIAVQAFGSVDPAKMLKAMEDIAIFMGGIGIIIAAFGALDAIDGSADFMQRGIEIVNSLKTVTLSLILIMGEAWIAVQALGGVDPAKMLKAMEDIAIFMGGIGILIAAFGAIDALDGSADFMQRGIEIFDQMAGVVMTLLMFMGKAWIAVQAFGGIDPAKMLKAMEDIGIFMGGIGIIIAAFGALDALDGTANFMQNGIVIFGQLGTIIDTLLAMMGAAWITVQAMGSVDPSKMVKALTDLGLFIGGLEVVILAFGAIDALDGTANLQQNGIEMFKQLGEVLPIMFGAIGTAWVAAKALGSVDPATMGNALIVLAEFIGGLELILVALGGLNELTGGGFADLIASAGEVLVATGEAIGGLVGGLGAGVMDAIGPSLVTFGQQLGQFATGAKPLFDLFATLTPAMAAGAAIMGAALLEITAASVLEGLISFVSGGAISLGSFGEELAAFAVPFGLFAASAALLTPGVAEGVKNMAAALLAITAADVLSGLTSWFTGGTMDMAAFGEQLAAFGEPFKKFADGLVGVDGTTVESASNAALTMAKLYEVLPKEGGWMNAIMGESGSLGTFGEELALLGPGLKKFSDSVVGIDSTSVSGAVAAAEAVAGIYDALPKTEGWMQVIMGENMTLTDFAGELVTFGPKLKAFSLSVAGIVEADVIAAANAGKAVAGIYDSLPETSGKLQEWVGTTMSLTTFGGELASFGPNLKAFADSIVNMDSGAVQRAGYAASGIASIYEKLPETSGKLQEWVGTTMSLTKFGEELASFGPHLMGFSLTVAGMVAADVTTAINCATIVANFATTLPVQGEWTEFFTGTTMTLSGFGAELEAFGPHLKAFATQVTGMNATQVQRSAYAAQALADFATKLPEQNGVWDEWFGSEQSLVKFGEELEAFGPHLKAYGVSIAGIDSATVQASGYAAESLAKMASLVPEQGGFLGLFSGDSSIETFGAGLEKFGQSFKKYYDSIVGIVPETLNGVVASMYALVEFIKSIVYLDFDSFTEFATSMDESATGGIAKFTEAFGAADTKAKEAVKMLYDLVVAASQQDTELQKFTDAGVNVATVLAAGLASKDAEIYAIGVASMVQYVLGLDTGLLPAQTSAWGIMNGIDAELWDPAWQTRSYQAGEYLMEGLIDGIDSLASDVEDKLEQIMEDALAATEAVAEINSPSERTTQIGEYLGEGLYNGIETNHNRIVSLSETLTRDVLHALSSTRSVDISGPSALSKALTEVTDNILNEISNGIDVTPVITPVVDLSNMDNRLASFFDTPRTLETMDMSLRASNIMATGSISGKTEEKTSEPTQEMVNYSIGPNYFTVNNDVDPTRVSRELLQQARIAERSRGRSSTFYQK